MTRNLVVGTSGLVGSHLFELLTRNGENVTGTYFNHSISSAIQLDIRQKNEVKKIIENIKPEIIYIPAAFPNVDYCEIHPEETYQINVTGIKNVVQAANRINAKVVFFSSDYIFDGVAGPYEEDDTAHPISEYGRQKLITEHFISLFAKKYLIIRTTVIFGWEHQGKNFVFRLIQSLQNNQAVKVPRDQVGSPTYVNNLAEISIELARATENEVINIAGSDCVSRYDFALTVAQIFKLDERLIHPVRTEELNQPAKRPLNAGLKLDKLYQISKIKVIDYKSAVRLMFESNYLVQKTK
jgi:dTDP-4-dehydrorhamnose reductase